MWRWSGLVGMVLVSIFLMGIGQEEVVLAKDILFKADAGVGEGQNRANVALWVPSAIHIDQKQDLGEPLYFILENPTELDHEFAVHGLYMFLPEQKTRNETMPIKVPVKAKSTVKIEVSPEGLNKPKDFGARYEFFCPLHMKQHPGGVIHVD